MMRRTYYDYCLETTLLVKKLLLVDDLGFTDEEMIITFQSRFAKAEWLKPYTDIILEYLPEQGIKDVAILSPTFSTDYLERLEELIHEKSEVFLEAGDKTYYCIAALNGHDDINALFNILEPILGTIYLTKQ